MDHPLAYKLTLPTWTNHIPNDAQMSAKEVAGFFNYKCISSLDKAVIAGRLPPHNKGLKQSHNKRRYWSMKVLREFLEERKDD